MEPQEGDVTGQFDNPGNEGQYFEEQEVEAQQFEGKVSDPNNNDPLVGGQVEDIVANIGPGIDMPAINPALTTQKEPEEAMDETETFEEVVQVAEVEGDLGPAVTETDD